MDKPYFEPMSMERRKEINDQLLKALNDIFGKDVEFLALLPEIGMLVTSLSPEDCMISLKELMNCIDSGNYTAMRGRSGEEGSSH